MSVDKMVWEYLESLAPENMEKAFIGVLFTLVLGIIPMLIPKVWVSMKDRLAKIVISEKIVEDWSVELSQNVLMRGICYMIYPLIVVGFNLSIMSADNGDILCYALFILLFIMYLTYYRRHIDTFNMEQLVRSILEQLMIHGLGTAACLYYIKFLADLSNINRLILVCLIISFEEYFVCQISIFRYEDKHTDTDKKWLYTYWGLSVLQFIFFSTLHFGNSISINIRLNVTTILMWIETFVILGEYLCGMRKHEYNAEKYVVFCHGDKIDMTKGSIVMADKGCIRYEYDSKKKIVEIRMVEEILFELERYRFKRQEPVTVVLADEGKLTGEWFKYYKKSQWLAVWRKKEEGIEVRIFPVERIRYWKDAKTIIERER